MLPVSVSLLAPSIPCPAHSQAIGRTRVSNSNRRRMSACHSGSASRNSREASTATSIRPRCLARLHLQIGVSANAARKAAGPNYLNSKTLEQDQKALGQRPRSPPPIPRTRRQAWPWPPHPHQGPGTILRERVLDAAFAHPTTFAYGAAHIPNHSKRDGHKTAPEYKVEHDQVLNQLYHGRKAWDETDWRVADREGVGTQDSSSSPKKRWQNKKYQQNVIEDVFPSRWGRRFFR